MCRKLGYVCLNVIPVHHEELILWLYKSGWWG